MKTFDDLIYFFKKFLWGAGARQRWNCSPGSNCFLFKVLPKGANYFLDKNFQYFNDRPCILKKKLNFLKKRKRKKRHFVFLGGSKEAISATKVTFVYK